MTFATLRFLLGLLTAIALDTASAFGEKDAETYSPFAREAIQLVDGVCKGALAGAAVTVEMKVRPREPWQGIVGKDATFLLHCSGDYSADNGIAMEQGPSVVDSQVDAAGTSDLMAPPDGWMLCLAWVAIWFCLHCCCQWAPPGLLLLGATRWLERGRLQPLGPAHRARWRCLACAQLHSMLALSAGLVFSIRDYNSCQALNMHFTLWHQVAFAATIGYRIAASCVSLVAGDASRLCSSVWILRALDRAAVVGVLSICLSLRRFAAAGVALGLLSEFPMVLVNVREVVQLRWPVSSFGNEGCREFWDVTLFLAFLVRGIPLIIYIDGCLQGWPSWRQNPYPQSWHVAVALIAASSLAFWIFLVAARAHDVEELHRADAENEASLPTDDVEGTACVGHIDGAEQDDGAPESRSTLRACWLTIHGVAYDVQDFLEEHPGGAARLLQLAGEDATMAFETAGHSPAALERLGRLPVMPRRRGQEAVEAGRGCSGPASYNFLVQPHGTGHLMTVTSHVALAMIALFTARDLPGERTPSSALLGMSFIGLVACLLGNASPATQAGSLRASQHRLRRIPMHAAAVSLVLFATTVQLATAPSIALGAMGTLLTGALRAPPPREALSAPVSWSLLALHAIPKVGAAEGGMCHDWSSIIVGALAMTLSMSVLCHIAEAAEGAMRSIICRAALWALGTWLVLCVLSARVPSWASEQLWPGSDPGAAWPSLLAGVSVAAAACAMFRALMDHSGRSTPAAAASWAALLCGFLAAALHLRDGGVSLPGCLALCGWMLQGRHLACLVEAEVRAPPRRGLRPALHLHQVLFLLDSARAVLAMLVWGSIGHALEALVTWVLPSGLRVFAFEAPIDDFGGRLRTGVCLFLEGEQSKPGHVVCNVGHIPTADLKDVRSTVRRSLEIMRELSGGLGSPAGAESTLQPVPGFIANVICVLPEAKAFRSILGVNWKSVRQINLSVWSDQAAAAAWYRGSSAHAAILAEHAGGGLRTFGNLLLSLDPVRVAWQRRCRSCAAVVEGLESRPCPKCGGAAFELPVF